jgi:hypothetical protein
MTPNAVGAALVLRERAALALRERAALALKERTASWAR